MRTNYAPVLLMALALPGTLFSQWVTKPSAQFPQAIRATQPHHPPLEDGARDGGDIVWSEDFANGLAGNNPSGAWTTDGANGNIWRFNTNAPRGAYTPTNQRIQSTTFSNGFAKFASDSANCTWAGNTPTALPTSEFTSWEGSLVSPTIDLSATPYVEIEFQQRSRFCCGDSPFFLEVSTDGGSTWPTAILTNEGLPTNQDPTFTETRRFNITQAISGDPSNVKIRFRHSSDAGTSHYFWQVDDIKIIELNSTDVRMTGSGTNFWDLAAAATYDSLPYTVFPYSQLRPMGLNMTVLNNGSVELTNLTANFKVERGTDVILDQDQNVDALSPGEIRTIFVDPGFTPPAEEGTYDLSTMISADGDLTPDDNSGMGSFKVHPSYYGRDGGTATSIFEDGDGSGSEFVLGNMFHAAYDDMLYAIAVAFNTGSEEGVLIRGQLLDANQSDFPVIENTDEYSIEPGQVNAVGGSNFVIMEFNPPVQLTAGMDYMAAVQCFGNARVSSNGSSPAQTSFIFYDNGTGPTWFYTTQTPMVRMVVGDDINVGLTDVVENAGTSLGQNMPNPTRDQTNIAYSLDDAAKVSFEVRDMSGKLVMAQNLGSMPAGQHRIQLDTRTLGEGVYFYTMTADEVRLSKRMTVIR
ncbi:MAG: T9SS type A sorting domain-containing protein [Flavobacteriales bacterium]|nr:T9SS type A sorting domain-containing protein [Flavobacteriales bacterium]